MRDAPSTTWLFVTMMPSLDQTKPEPSDCEVYERSRPPKKPNGSKNGSTCRRRMVASVWMFTTEGSTLCATTTIGVRRAALTVGGNRIGARRAAARLRFRDRLASDARNSAMTKHATERRADTSIVPATSRLPR